MKEPVEPAPRSVRETLALAREVMRSMRRALVLLRETDARLTVAMAVVTLLSAALPASIAYVAKRIVDGLVRALSTGSPADRAAVLRDLALEFGLAIASLALHRAAGLIEMILRARFATHVTERIIEKSLSLGLEEFEDPELLDQINRARKGASYRALDMVHGIFSLGQSVLTLVAYGGLLVSISGWMHLLIVLAAVPEFIVQTRFSRDAFRLFHWRSAEARRQYYLEAVLTEPEHVKEVRLFGLGPLLFGRYREVVQRFWREDRDLTLRRGAWGFLLGALSYAAYYAAYLWVVLQALASAVTLGGVGLFVAVFRDAQGIVGSMLHTIGGAYEDHLYLSSLFDFFAIEPASRGYGRATEGPSPDDGVRFEHVSFTYPDAERPVLEDVSLHLPRGHKLALVGENGAGKTTLIKLLTRLYRPSSGRITLDGLPLSEWDEDALRARIGVIFQDFVQYQFTVGENIGVGDVRAFDDEARWREASKLGMADTFIEALPEKYRAQLGRWFPGGSELSLGQWQKVALSRAFMRRDADILVLDEPTASMDAAAEAQVFDRFRALTEHRIAVLISHRFSTVRMADSIAVLEKGRIIEQGTHPELIARGGRYAELFSLQARGYR